MKKINWFFKGLILFIKNMLSTGTNESAKGTNPIRLGINK